MHLFLPTAMCDRRILSLDHKDLLSRKSRPVFRSTTRPSSYAIARDWHHAICGRVTVTITTAARDLGIGSIATARTRVEASREASPGRSKLPLETRRFLLGLRLRTTPNPPSKQWARQFLIWFIKRLFSRALSIDCCFVFYLDIYITYLRIFSHVDILLILEKSGAEGEKERARSRICLALFTRQILISIFHIEFLLIARTRYKSALRRKNLFSLFIFVAAFSR